MAALSVVVLSLTLALPSPARADLSGDYDTICGKVENPPIKPAGTQPTPEFQQKKSYCDAAKGAVEAADADSLMWKVWAAVAGVCATACGVSVAGAGSNQYICMSVNLGAAATDAVVTKQFATALASLATTGGGLLVNHMMNKGLKEGAKEKDIAACLSAAVAATQAFAKHSSMNLSEASARSSLESAKALKSDDGTTTSPELLSGPQIALSGDGTGASGGGASDSGGASASVIAAPDAKTGCTAAKASGQTQGILSCALATDTNLPSFVRSDKFPKEFQKDSGIGLNEFLNKNHGPKQALAQAMGGPLNSVQSAKLLAALDSLEKQEVKRETDGATYAGGGGAGAGSGGGEGGGMDPALGEMMAGLMDKFMPKDGKAPEGPQSGVSAVVFANAHRSPAKIAEDTTLNIFDRVTYRYYFVGKRMQAGGN